MIQYFRWFYFFLPFLFTTGLFAQTVKENCLDGHIFVKLNSNSPLVLSPYDSSEVALNLLIGRYACTSIEHVFPGGISPLDKVYRFAFSKKELVDDFISELQLLPFIKYAEYVPLYTVSFIPSDMHPEQWYLPKIKAPDAWQLARGSKDVVIAIIDNGVNLAHEDIAPILWVNPNEIPGNGLDDDLNGYPDDIHGWDVADNNNDPSPPPGIDANSPFNHGTHCAGIASAATNNNRGIASIGFGTRIMAVKCAPDSESGEFLTHAYEGVFYAIQAGADIINMSFGSKQRSITGQTIINTALQRGIILVAAAGNSNTDTLFYPAAYAGVLNVGATDINDRRATFSNYGTHIDVMAPGVRIYSTLAFSNSAYGFSSGTSMAAPLAAGLAGLLKSLNPQLTHSQIREAIIEGAVDIDHLNPGFAEMMGSGRINAFNTINRYGFIDEEDEIDPPLVNIMVRKTGENKFIIIENFSGEALDLSLYNVLGQQLLRERYASENVIVPVNPLFKGFYLVAVNVAGKQYVRKLVF